MNAQDTLLIAVDGGGTGCRVAVGTPGAGVLGEAKGGPANINTSFDGAVDNITAAASQALKAADLAQSDLQDAVAHVGLAGADTAQGRARVVQSLPYGRCTVTGDRETSVSGVLGAQDGFVIALGTGTIIARQQGGQIRTVNGWGFGISDHGSGAWLGKTLLAQVLLGLDEMAPVTDLNNQISAELGGLEGVVAFSQTAGPGDYAKFAPLIFQSAEAEDTLALDILRSGAEYLQTGLIALGFEEGQVLSLAGGVGPHYAPYLAAPYTRTLQPPKGKALDGAFNLARQAALSAE